MNCEPGHLSSPSDRCRDLAVCINDDDTEFQQTALRKGYARSDELETVLRLPLSPRLPEVQLQDRSKIMNLDEDHDREKVVSGLWRGFDNAEELVEDEALWIRLNWSAPGFQPELHVGVVAPDGDIACYCGTWYVPANKAVYVEPVCTVPAFRRRGLGRAAVLEAARRCAGLGAATAYVVSDQKSYHATGFEKAYVQRYWKKKLPVRDRAAATRQR